MPRRPSARCYDPADADAIVGLRGAPGFSRVRTMSGTLYHASCEPDPFADAANAVAMYFSPLAEAALKVIRTLGHRDGHDRRFQDCHLYTYRTTRPLRVMQYVYTSVADANAGVFGDSGSARQAVATLPPGYDGVHLTVHHDDARTRTEAWTEFILKPDAAKTLALVDRRFEPVMQYHDLVADRATGKVWRVVDNPTAVGVQVTAGAQQWNAPGAERELLPYDRVRLVTRLVWGRSVVRPSAGGAPVMITGADTGDAARATGFQVWSPSAGISRIDWAREDDYVHVEDVLPENMHPWFPPLEQLGAAPRIIKQRFWNLFLRDNPDW